MVDTQHLNVSYFLRVMAQGIEICRKYSFRAKQAIKMAICFVSMRLYGQNNANNETLIKKYSRKIVQNSGHICWGQNQITFSPNTAIRSLRYSKIIKISKLQHQFSCKRAAVNAPVDTDT